MPRAEGGCVTDHARAVLLGVGFCMICAVCSSFASAASAVPLETISYCESLEDARDNASTRRDLQELESLAQTYIESCRGARDKDAIAIAMSEIAYVRRVRGAWLEALSQAQACINFHYLAVQCHAEKARALIGLRMPREADEVVKTGFEVASRAQAQADHEIRTAEGRRQAMTAKDYDVKVALAKWKLNVIDDGRTSLNQVQTQLKAAGGKR